MTDELTHPLDSEGGASWKGVRGPRMQPSSREIKMLRAICATCEEAAGGSRYLPKNWQDDCPHDPYISFVGRKVTENVYEDEADAEGNPTGVKLITGQKTRVIPSVQPNWVGVTAANGMNKGRGVDKALRKGFIYPQMLRSPAYPEGIKRRCQFRECYAEDLKKYKNGWFCREVEARLVAVSDTETTWQVSFDRRSSQFQKDVLDKMAVGS